MPQSCLLIVFYSSCATVHPQVKRPEGLSTKFNPFFIPPPPPVPCLSVCPVRELAHVKRARAVLMMFAPPDRRRCSSVPRVCWCQCD
jgi:hypothetical protein